MSILTSKEMFINMKNVPKYNPRKNYFEQGSEVLKFYEEEKRKITEGVIIGGYFIHPWLYFHLNFFKTPIPITDKNGIQREEIINPPLDDNFAFMIEGYKEAQESNKGMFLFGCRGASKSSQLASLTAWLNTTKENGTTSIIGGSDLDLKAISSLLETGFTKVHPAFFIPRLRSDWESEIEFGIKEKNNQKIIHSRISITNADKGTSKSSEKGAGLSPVGYIMDEALHEDSLIYQEKGSKKIKDIKVGEEIFGADGKLTKVLTKINPGIVDTYKFTLSDGREVISSDNHLWKVYDTRVNIYKEVTTEQIRKKYYYTKSDKRYDIEYKSLIYSLPISKSIEYKEKNFLIAPYWLGLYLGDGGKGSGTIYSIDNEILEYCENYSKELGLSFNLKAPCKDRCPDYRSANIIKNKGSKNNILVDNLRKYNIYREKAIPKEYLLGSVEQRLELLRGLMDTDGGCTSDGGIEFSSSYEGIYSGFKTLCEGLGIRIKINKGIGLYTDKNGEKIECRNKVRFSLYTDLRVFNLSRKIKKVKDTRSKKSSKGYKKAKAYKERVTIKEITYEGKNQVYCIGVDNKDKLFLTNNQIVTHNCGKYSFRAILKSALPSFMTPTGAKLVHILSGCVCAGTKVWNNDGELINIEDIKPSEGILGYDINNFKPSEEEITYWQPPHEKLCYRVETTAGRVLECSDDHPIYCRDTKINTYCKTTKKRGIWMGFREAKDLKVKDLIGVSSFLPFTGSKIMWEPRLMGRLIGDGTYGIVDQVKHHKTLPKDIHSYTHSDICELLGGFFDADGHVSAISTGSSDNYSVNLSSGHKSILIEVQLLLQRLGVHGRVHYKKDTRFRAIGNGKPFQSKGYYVLSVSDKLSVIEFHKNIQFLIKYKQDKLNIAVESLTKKGMKKSIGYTNMRFEQIKSIEPIGMKPVYNLTAGTTHTYIANGIITHNTGGNETLSKDAREVLSDLDAYRLIPMNWKRLEKGVPDEAITWERSKREPFSLFVPGQMSYRLDVPKVKKKFSEYLGIQHNDLDNIEINITDWVPATEKIMGRNKSLKKERDRQENQMYFPLETADIFLTSSTNPFPVPIIEKRIRELEDKGLIGQDIGIYKDGGKFKREFVKKKRAKVSHGGGLADAPIILFGEFPEGETPPKGLYVSGLDAYKLDQSDTDSLGAFYVIKRRSQAPNEPCETIAASYAGRPERMRDFNATCEMMADTWDAECLMESIDISFKQYLESKGRENDILADNVNFASLLSKKKHKARSKFGLYPTKENNAYRFNVLIDYCKEEHIIDIDDDGNKIFKLGVEFLDDIDLLKEMRDWFKGGNFDRIVAFSHALILARELDKNHIQPERQAKRDKYSSKEQEKRRRLLGSNRYGMTRGNNKY